MKSKKKLFFLYALLILIFFFFSRLVSLLKIPIFTDEAIYLRWSQIASYDPSWRFISLTDGKQPLFMWVTMVVMRIIKDPLLAGRLVSVFSGLGTILGLFLLSKEIFKKDSVGFYSSLIYLVLPLTLLYDKLALVDTMLTMFGVWSLFLAIKLARDPRLDYSLLLGATLGFAYLTKSPAVFFLILSFLAVIFSSRKNIFKFLVYCFLSTLISQGFYNILRLSPLMFMIAQKNSFFVRSFSEVRAEPFVLFWGNLKGLKNWLIGYFSWPLIILSLVGLVFKIKENFRENFYLLAWFFGPIIAYGLFAKVMYPRYILFFAPALIIMIASSLDTFSLLVKNKLLFFILCFLIFIPTLHVSFDLIKNPVYAQIPLADQGQFFDSQFAGGGIKEVVAYFQKESQNKKITLYTEGTFGLLPFSIELYFYDNPNMKIVGIWPLDKIPSEKIKYEKGRENYIIINETQQIPREWPLEKILEVRKGKSNKYLRLFKILPYEVD